MKLWCLLLGCAALMLVSTNAAIADPACERRKHDGNSYTLCYVDVAQNPLRLFLERKEGGLYGHFAVIQQSLDAEGKYLSFAMNAGMYHADRSPVGLYIEEGKQVQRLITSPGPGNFGLLPNGVLCLRDGRADVMETIRFEQESPECTYATQSGPMLVIDGELHPRFLRDGTSRYVRNGVGTSADGTQAVFVISDDRVTFHEFGSFFRDTLNVPNALYFDGNISRFHAPQLDRSDRGFLMGPIIGTVSEAAAN